MSYRSSKEESLALLEEVQALRTETAHLRGNLLVPRIINIRLRWSQDEKGEWLLRVDGKEPLNLGTQLVA